ncbi:M1 family aminopeptidase [Pasteuria penetrans]|uniref:M1 family aminopeptidase n=1 Tax=Pasteuria penetrans TaxID=86005 RepID=UPI000FB12560|nr:M1 family aminopeptidase [Pasteuria penetrans]
MSTGRNPVSAEHGAQKVSRARGRDFAALISSEYQGVTGTMDGVRVNLWFPPGVTKSVANAMQGEAVSSLRYFSEKFGSYRDEVTDELDVVLTIKDNSGFSGAEYPGFVTAVAPSEKKAKTGATVGSHEIAHQWWYGFVGNDQVREPWLDEGLTTFSAVMYERDVVGKDDFFIPNVIREVVNQTDKANEFTAVTPVDDVYHHSPATFHPMVYTRSSMMLFMLSKEIGGMEKLFSIMKEYHRQYRYKNATGCDFIRLVENQSNKDLRGFFKKWLFRLPKGCASDSEGKRSSGG